MEIQKDYYKVHNVKMDDIIEPRDPLRIGIDPDKVRELAENIDEENLRSPIVLRAGDKPYEISEGHRRFLAFKMLGRTHIPAYIREMDDEVLLLSRAIENLQREDLSPIEEGKAYRSLMDKFKLSFRALAKRIGKSVAHIRQCIDCLDLPAFAQEAIHRKQVSYVGLLELMKIQDPSQREMYIRYACENGATIPVCKQWVDGWLRMKNREMELESSTRPYDPHVGDAVNYLCKLCNKPSNIRQMTVIYLCPLCNNYLFQGGPHPDEVRSQ